jgi:hypothetical protein
MHDAKPGLMVLTQRGVETGTLAFDTLLAAFLLGGKAHTLEELIADRLGLSPGERAARGSQERTRNVCARAGAVLLQVLNFGAMLWALITYASAS